jgi:hypothetical protein
VSPRRLLFTTLAIAFVGFLVYWGINQLVSVVGVSSSASQPDTRTDSMERIGAGRPQIETRVRCERCSRSSLPFRLI